MTKQQTSTPPTSDPIRLNAEALNQELNWFSKVLETRMELALGNQPTTEGYNSIFEVLAPDLSEHFSVYASICRHYEFQETERLLLMLGMAPHLRPEALDLLFLRNPDTNRSYTEIGGLIGQQHGGFLPTGETAAFLIAGRNMDVRIRLIRIFGPGHPFARFGVLKLEPAPEDEPALSGAIRLSRDYYELFTFGHAAKPNYSAQFPAQLIETSLGWDDLVLSAEVRDQVEVVRTWVESSQAIMADWEDSKSLKPGYRALFYGPPGTGKTLTAGLIGKSADKDVYRIDGSQIVSKWVGETEKNLARIFDMAEHKDWILFFDEADALFGKRSSQGSGQERHGNQQVAYLLQRTESYPGTVILATNLKSNIDEAFMRRFQSTIYFPMPTATERQLLWEKTFAGGLSVEDKVDFVKIGRQFEVTGGSIVNVLKYCAIMSRQRGVGEVMLEDVLVGVEMELRKEGRRV